ncbi:hypothetical protein CsSME_00026330 [Camellia sinensis var. sinensis]
MPEEINGRFHHTAFFPLLFIFHHNNLQSTRHHNQNSVHHI